MSPYLAVITCGIDRIRHLSQRPRRCIQYCLLALVRPRRRTGKVVPVAFGKCRAIHEPGIFQFSHQVQDEPGERLKAP